MTTEKRKIHRVADANGTLIQVLPETSAEQVTLADTAGKYTATNVEDALAEVMNVAQTGGVTGVKGDAETEYRKGNVNITKANIGLGNVDNTADADKVVKEAGKVSKDLRLAGTLDGGGITSVPYDGSKDTQLSMDGDDFVMEGNTSSSTQTVSYSLKKTGVTPGTYQGIQVDNKGRVIAATDKDYATKQELQEAIAGKARTFTYDNYQAFVTATDALAKTAMGVGDNVYIKTLGVPDMWCTRVNDVSTLYTYTSDQAIVDALDTTVGLTVGYFTFSKLETEKVDLDDYQTKTDTGLQTNDKTVVGAINEVKSTADEALSKAVGNETDIAHIIDGTTKVKNAEHADTADTATSAGSADTAANATNVTTNINGNSISSIFESNGLTVKEATHAQKATTVEGSLYIGYGYNKKNVEYTGYSGVDLKFSSDDFEIDIDNNPSGLGLGFSEEVSLKNTGVAAGQYSAVNVDAKGRVTAGGKSIEWGTSGQTKPSDDLMVGGLFMELQS